MATEGKTRPVTPVMRVCGLTKAYAQRPLFSRNTFVVEALKDVDFELLSTTLIALIGESGSGKSTLARCMALLEKPDGGEIWFEGQEMSRASPRELAALRPRVQMVFQDAAGALNPRFTAAQVIAEPLKVQRRESEARLRSRVCELMEQVGLSPNWADRHPHEFSGGQRQRLAIARAIALKPEVLILDEPTSGLDLSTQAQIVNLLLDLRESCSLGCLLISHDLSLVSQVADYLAVMHQGRIIEQGTCEAVLGHAKDPCTRKLVASAHLGQAAFKSAKAGGQR